uniref:hypothetical protein n=1 Tax=Yersinia aldovae TaxID=29483 RepID=UPI00119E5EF0
MTQQHSFTSKSKAALPTQETNLRGEEIIIVAEVKGVRSVHFVSQVKLCGCDNDLWYSIGERDLFSSVEQLMVVNGICHNVVRIDVLNINNETSSDCKVIL